MVSSTSSRAPARAARLERREDHARESAAPAVGCDPHAHDLEAAGVEPAQAAHRDDASAFDRDEECAAVAHVGGVDVEEVAIPARVGDLAAAAGECAPAEVAQRAAVAAARVADGGWRGSGQSTSRRSSALRRGDRAISRRSA